MLTQGMSWGRYPKVHQNHLQITQRPMTFPSTVGKLLPRGNGRSYGDSCLIPNGTLLHMRGVDRFISFDASTGRLCCEAGVTLAEIIDLVLPQGWFLPVTPGTRFVTVAGAIANDVHGKNHHFTGTFGHYVKAFELLRSDGSQLLCTSDNLQDGWFSATVGGLGLTGLITWAEIQLRRVASPYLETENIRFGSLEEFFSISSASSATHEYSVAWIDCLSTGRSRGRGHFTRADHSTASIDERPRDCVTDKNIPFIPPFSLVNKFTLRPFNTLYFWRQRASHKRFVSHLLPFFYPLDGIRNWNRMYGPDGFLQYQCVLPPTTARDGVDALLEEISRSGSGSFLAVLKEFGNIVSRGMLSFPRPGTTLALDFPNNGQGVMRLLDRLDRIVDEAGGALYPAKDARMSAASFQRAYVRWQEFSQYLDPRFSSGFWRRVTE